MDVQTNKMIMFGGVALLIIVIIAIVIVMKHKNDVEKSPIIIHTTAGPVVVPSTTPISTAPSTTMPSTIPVVVPSTTMPTKLYLKSPNDYYLILKENSPVSSTKNQEEATPIKLNQITIGKFNYYAIMTEDNLYVSIDTTAKTVVYRNDISINSTIDGVTASSLLIASVAEMSVIVYLNNSNSKTILDQNSVLAIIYDKPGQIFFYPFFRNEETASVISAYNIISWTEVS